MRAWLLAGILLAAGGVAAALLWNTSGAGSSTVISVKGCGAGSYGVGGEDFEGPSDGAFTIAFHDGDLIPITVPVGEYRIALEADGGWIRPVEPFGMRSHPSRSYYVGGCADELGTAQYQALGVGSLRVSYWMLGDGPQDVGCRQNAPLAFGPPDEVRELDVAAGEAFGVRVPSGGFAIGIGSDDTRVRSTDDGHSEWRRHVNLSGCSTREDGRTYVAESAGRVRVSTWLASG